MLSEHVPRRPGFLPGVLLSSAPAGPSSCLFSIFEPSFVAEAAVAVLSGAAPELGFCNMRIRPQFENTPIMLVARLLHTRVDSSRKEAHWPDVF